MRPRGLELQQGELGDLVEQEMAATSAAVESAVSRIEVSFISVKYFSLIECKVNKKIINFLYLNSHFNRKC